MNFAEKIMIAEAAVRGAVKGTVTNSFGSSTRKIVDICVGATTEATIQYGKIKMVRKIMEK